MPLINRPVFTHPGQPQMQAEVILASRSPVPEAPVIYTIRLRYPRIIHGEAKTHRIMSLSGDHFESLTADCSIMDDESFSRNARSSRAVPVKTMLNEVRTIPFVPWHWGKNQKGMQAGEECNELLFLHDTADYWINREKAWRLARDKSVQIAEAFMNSGYHKQIPNRLLEPFSWIDTLITSTDWANFLWLRDHADAEPHLQDLARLVNEALANCVQTGSYQMLKPGQWHLPYITDADWEEGLRDHSKPSEEDMQNHYQWLCKISAARCARISYAPFDGDPSYERELERYNSLVTADRVHASPLEHQATPDTQHMLSIDVIDDEGRVQDTDTKLHWKQSELHGNFTGWIQARKLVPNERYTAPV